MSWPIRKKQREIYPIRIYIQQPLNYVLKECTFVLNAARSIQPCLLRATASHTNISLLCMLRFTLYRRIDKIYSSTLVFYVFFHLLSIYRSSLIMLAISHWLIVLYPDFLSGLSNYLYFFLTGEMLVILFIFYFSYPDFESFLIR